MDAEVIDVEVDGDPRPDEQEPPRQENDREAQARRYREKLQRHARESAQRGTEALVEAANAGLMAGALRAAEPFAEFLREIGDDLLSVLNPDEPEDRE
jgi:predicted Rossmann-fold nucleotide-binding protein